MATRRCACALAVGVPYAVCQIVRGSGCRCWQIDMPLKVTRPLNHDMIEFPRAAAITKSITLCLAPTVSVRPIAMGLLSEPAGEHRALQRDAAQVLGFQRPEVMPLPLRACRGGAAIHGPGE